MEILYAFFAEAAQVTSDGQLNILGADLNSLTFQGMAPWSARPLSFVVGMRLELEECGHLLQFSAVLHSPSGAAIEPRAESEILVPIPEHPDLANRLRLVMEMTGLTFPEVGVYQLRVRLAASEGGVVADKLVRLRVVHATPQPQPA